MTKTKIRPEWERECKSLLAEYDLKGVVILAIRRDGVIDAHTYGEDKRKCAALAKWIEGFIERGLSIIPFQTVFGWGNNGLPKPLPKETKVPAGWETFAR